MNQKNLADLYGLDPIPWSRALEALESAKPKTQTPFLATTRPDGRPHVAAVGAIWDSGRIYFREWRRDSQEPEPRRERQLRDLNVPDGHRPRRRGHG